MIEDIDQHALFLDIDGTIIGFMDHPDSVIVPDETLQLLIGLNAHLNGALAFISGRSLTMIDTLFSPYQFNAAGCHGAELRSQGRRFCFSIQDEIEEIKVSLLNQFVSNDLYFEDKIHSFAIHYRNSPYLRLPILEAIQMLIANNRVRIIEGHYVIEIVPRVVNKGRAISYFMLQEPYVNRTPIFFGDDFTDEDGFRAVNEMNGKSILVGNRSTEARFSVNNVNEVIDILKKWINY